jgi:hypothetical protein
MIGDQHINLDVLDARTKRRRVLRALTEKRD